VLANDLPAFLEPLLTALRVLPSEVVLPELLGFLAKVIVAKRATFLAPVLKVLPTFLAIGFAYSPVVPALADDIVESAHPIGSDVHLAWCLEFPGASAVDVELDPRSRVLVDDQDCFLIASGPDAAAKVVFRADNRPLPRSVRVPGSRVFAELQSSAGYGLWGIRAVLRPRRGGDSIAVGLKSVASCLAAHLAGLATSAFIERGGSDEERFAVLRPLIPAFKGFRTQRKPCDLEHSFGAAVNGLAGLSPHASPRLVRPRLGTALSTPVGPLASGGWRRMQTRVAMARQAGDSQMGERAAAKCELLADFHNVTEGDMSEAGTITLKVATADFSAEEMVAFFEREVAARRISNELSKEAVTFDAALGPVPRRYFRWRMLGCLALPEGEPDAPINCATAWRIATASALDAEQGRKTVEQVLMRASPRVETAARCLASGSFELVRSGVRFIGGTLAEGIDDCYELVVLRRPRGPRDLVGVLLETIGLRVQGKRGLLLDDTAPFTTHELLAAECVDALRRGMAGGSALLVRSACDSALLERVARPAAALGALAVFGGRSSRST
jgi:hypothetical protein